MSAPAQPDTSRVFDLMATACQRHSKSIEDAHRQHVAAIERLHQEQVRNLRSRIRQMERERLANSQPCAERAALVDILAGLHGFHVNGKDGTLVVGELDIPITVSTQQTVLGLANVVNAERKQRRERQEVAK